MFQKNFFSLQIVNYTKVFTSLRITWCAGEEEGELEGLLAYLVTDATGNQFLVPSGLLPGHLLPTR